MANVEKLNSLNIETMTTKEKLIEIFRQKDPETDLIAFCIEEFDVLADQIISKLPEWGWKDDNTTIPGDTENDLHRAILQNVLRLKPETQLKLVNDILSRNKSVS